MRNFDYIKKAKSRGKSDLTNLVKMRCKKRIFSGDFKYKPFSHTDSTASVISNQSSKSSDSAIEIFQNVSLLPTPVSDKITALVPPKLPVVS
jgi:hypothetical protein